MVRELAGAEGAGFALDYDLPHSIGRLHANFGNVGMFVRAHAYIRCARPGRAQALRRDGGAERELPAGTAARRLPRPLRPKTVMHECVLTDRSLQDTGVTTLDIAKRLIDYGYHPPTIYFPLIVHGAIMIEPTESESLEGLDRFAEAMLAIAEEARDRLPKLVRTAPHHTRCVRDSTKREQLDSRFLRWQPAAQD